MKKDSNFSFIITVCVLVNVYLAFKADFQTSFSGFLLSTKKDNILFILYTWLFAGVLMHMFRDRQQFWYGMFECILVLIIGTFTFAYTVEKGVVEAVIVLAAGTFSFVRGFGNIRDGFEKDWAGSKLKK